MIRMNSISNLNVNFKNCSTKVHNGRILYLNHQSRQVSILPPKANWTSLDIYKLPYGWEKAVDTDGTSYYINHINKTTTYQLPIVNNIIDEKPQPRNFSIERDYVFGYGFIIGSECPTVIRCVNRSGPAEGKLLPGDQILNVNGVDVYSVKLTDLASTINSNLGPLNITVCQPYSVPNTSLKSSMLTQSKKELIKTSPCRVRFAENVTTNDTSPFYSIADNDENSETEDVDEVNDTVKEDDKDESKIEIKNTSSILEQVIKVHLENGQTKSFAYDSTTTVKNIIDLLIEKLDIKKARHFALCLEYVKSIKSNRMQTLQPDDLISKIADLPSSHNMKITFRFAFLPPDLDFYKLCTEDKVSFDYLYCQCLEDLKKDSIFAQLHYETALRLLSLRVQQLYLMLNNSSIQGQQKTGKESKSSFLKSSTNFLSNVVRSTIPNSSTSAPNITKTASLANYDSTTNNGIELTSQHFDTSAEHALKNSKKWIKQIADSYGLESFVPNILISKFKTSEIISHLNKCFNRNQFQLIPFVAKKFVKQNNVDQQLKENMDTSNGNNLITAATSGQSLLSFVSETTKKSSGDLSKVRINEDLVKLCFLILYTDIPWFGVHAFSLRNSLHEFRINELLTPFDKSLIERVEHDEVNNSKTGHLFKQVSKISAQVWLSPKIGICQIVRTPTMQASPYVLAKLDEIVGIKVTRHEECFLKIEIELNFKLCNTKEMKNSLFFVMDEPDANEFIYCLQTFFTLQFNDKLEIPIDYVVEKPWWSDDAPIYNGLHRVKPSLWSYGSIDWQTFYAEIKEIDLSKALPTYSECVDENNVCKKTKMYFDSKGNQIDLLTDSIGLNNSSKQSKSVQHDSDYSEEDYTSSKDEQDDSSELFNQNDNRFNNVKADEKEIYLHSNNQELLSDSDPISADLLMPGQLKATDSLLMMRQDENDDTISDTMMTTDCFFESDTDSNETNTFGDNYLQSIQLRSTCYDSNSLVIEVNKDHLTELNRMNGSEELILSNPMIMSNTENVEHIVYGANFDLNAVENDSFEESEDSLFAQGMFTLDPSEIHDPTTLLSPISDNTELMITTSVNDEMSFHSTMSYFEYNDQNQSKLFQKSFEPKENEIVQYTTKSLTDEDIAKLIPPPPSPLHLENVNRMLKVLDDHKRAIKATLNNSSNDLRDLHSSSSADSGFESNTITKYEETPYEKREYDECKELLRESREHREFIRHRDEIVATFERQENSKIILIDSIICEDAIKKYTDKLNEYGKEAQHIYLTRYYLPAKKDTCELVFEQIERLTQTCEKLIQSILDCSTVDILFNYSYTVGTLGSLHRHAQRLFHRSCDDNLTRNLKQTLDDLRTNVQNIMEAGINFMRKVENLTLARVRLDSIDTDCEGYKMYHYFKRMMAHSLRIDKFEGAQLDENSSRYKEYNELTKHSASLANAIKDLSLICTKPRNQIELV